MDNLDETCIFMSNNQQLVQCAGYFTRFNEWKLLLFMNNTQNDTTIQKHYYITRAINTSNYLQVPGCSPS